MSEILFGSGELFVVEETVDELGNPIEIETKVGESNGEATLGIEYETVDVRGGVNNQILKTFMTSQTVTFNAGIITFDLSVINKFIASKFSEDTTAGIRTLTINDKRTIPTNKLKFVHTKEDGKKITLLMYNAQNKSGLEWTFNNEEATAFSWEFTLAMDENSGNIVEIIEEI